MNIFFSASLYGRKKYQAEYERIIELVEKHGHKIKADHIMRASPEEVEEKRSKDDEKQFQKIIDGIKRSDALFIEASHPSLSVGYFLAEAVNLGKPIVVFSSGNEEPHLFKPLDSLNEKLTVVRYTNIEELDREVPLMLDFVAEIQDTRFNFFVSPTIASYLDWVAKDRRIPRSVYLRRLIDEDMAKTREYEG